MRASCVLMVLVLVALCAIPAAAGIGDNGLKCWTYGATCEQPMTITAQSTGDITGNLYYYSANFIDFVRIVDTNPNNSWTSPWMLENQLGTQQPKVDFGHALAGDVLVVELCDEQEQTALCASNSKNPYIFASDPTYSSDHVSHAVVNIKGNVSDLANGGGSLSALIWMEDLADKQHTDWDYNDSVIALHNVIVNFYQSNGNGIDAPTPEPGTICLLASGLAAGLIRLRKRN